MFFDCISEYYTNIELVEFLLQEFPCLYHYLIRNYHMILQNTIKYKNTIIFDWLVYLHDPRLQKCWTYRGNSLLRVASNEYIIKRLYELEPNIDLLANDGCTFFNICRKGNLRMIKWFHEKCPMMLERSLPSRVAMAYDDYMDDNSINNTVPESNTYFYYDNRPSLLTGDPEFLYKDIFQNYAELAVYSLSVEYTNSESITTQRPKYQYDLKEAIRWIHAHTSKKNLIRNRIYEYTIQNFCKHGRLDLIQLIYELNPNINLRANSDEHPDFVITTQHSYLNSDDNAYTDDDVMTNIYVDQCTDEHAMYVAMHSGHCQIVEWLHATVPHTFPWSYEKLKGLMRKMIDNDIIDNLKQLYHLLPEEVIFPVKNNDNELDSDSEIDQTKTIKMNKSELLDDLYYICTTLFNNLGFHFLDWFVEINPLVMQKHMTKELCIQGLTSICTSWDDPDYIEYFLRLCPHVDYSTHYEYFFRKAFENDHIHVCKYFHKKFIFKKKHIYYLFLSNHYSRVSPIQCTKWLYEVCAHMLRVTSNILERVLNIRSINIQYVEWLYDIQPTIFYTNEIKESIAEELLNAYSLETEYIDVKIRLLKLYIRIQPEQSIEYIRERVKIIIYYPPFMTFLYEKYGEEILPKCEPRHIETEIALKSFILKSPNEITVENMQNIITNMNNSWKSMREYSYITLTWLYKRYPNIVRQCDLTVPFAADIKYSCDTNKYPYVAVLIQRILPKYFKIQVSLNELDPTYCKIVYSYRKMYKTIEYNKKSEVCRICFDKIADNMTSCKHILCSTCASLINEKKCPFCRKEGIIFYRIVNKKNIEKNRRRNNKKKKKSKK